MAVLTSLVAALVALLAIGWIREFGIALWRRHRERQALRAHWRAVKATYAYYKQSPLYREHQRQIRPHSVPTFMPSEFEWRGPGRVSCEVPHDQLAKDIAIMEARMRGEWDVGERASYHQGEVSA